MATIIWPVLVETWVFLKEWGSILQQMEVCKMKTQTFSDLQACREIYHLVLAAWGIVIFLDLRECPVVFHVRPVLIFLPGTIICSSAIQTFHDHPKCLAIFLPASAILLVEGQIFRVPQECLAIILRSAGMEERQAQIFPGLQDFLVVFLLPVVLHPRQEVPTCQADQTCPVGPFLQEVLCLAGL